MGMHAKMHKQPEARPRHSGPAGSSSLVASKSSGNTISSIQRRVACPCGGGCPDCERENVLQPKLQVSAADDQYEHEADRIADQVMRMPEKRVQRQALDDVTDAEEENQAFVQPKLQTGINGQQATPAVQHNPGSLSGRGEPLSFASQSFFSSRMGYDFSQVRIHQGGYATELAGSVNARAFTLGRDVVFNQGEYSPNTASGRHLLAHELTHVIQQQRKPMLQRKILTRAGCPIDSYLTNKGVNFSRSPGNTLYVSGSRDMSTLDREILSTMLLSSRYFYVAGSTQPDVQSNLDEHVKTRKRVINFAAKKKYRFAAGSRTRVNTNYWGSSSGSYHVKPGVKPMTAYLDMINSSSYAVACHMATKATMLAGTNDMDYAKDAGVSWTDWIPGDWGYIENTTFNSWFNNKGEEGENMIYVGKGVFWGHISSKQTYKTIIGWWNLVKKWGIPWLLSWRKRPVNGLIK